jgi:hypothetical protein
MVENVTIVIRNVGERTLESCYKIVSGQVNSSNIFVINETPFSMAVLKTFQIGVESKKDWTLAIDADLLLTENAIEEMVSKANSISGELYVYQGMILDYLFGSYRFGGPHLYKTSVLPEALKIVTNNLSEIRPESFTYGELSKKGFIAYCDNTVYALHDYDQYPKDYYRKGFFHGKKALNDQLLNLLRFWRQNTSKNLNYQLALSGLFDGLVNEDELEVDMNFFNDLQIKNAQLNKINNAELPILDFEINYVETVISEHKKEFPGIQPQSFNPYYLDSKGKHIVFFHKNPILIYITKLFIYVGNLLLKKGLKMRQS